LAGEKRVYRRERRINGAMIGARQESENGTGRVHIYPSSFLFPAHG
jgi:hypothetical protein